MKVTSDEPLTEKATPMKKISIKLFASVSLTKLNLVATGIFLMASSASAATRYVWQDSSSPAPPYTNWTTAAHVIQDAVKIGGPA
jgi:hypothetical protein